MCQDTIPAKAHTWHDSAHASLCLLGSYLRQSGFFEPLEKRMHIQQKVIKYTPVQKLEMFPRWGESRLAHQPDPAGRSGVVQSLWVTRLCRSSRDRPTLDAATEADVSALRDALAETFRRYSQARRHDFSREPLILDLDLSP